MKRIVGAAAFGAATLIGCGLSAPSARAGFIVTLQEVGSSVIASGSGAIDLTGLSFLTNSNGRASMRPNAGVIFTGPTSFEPTVAYQGISGPRSFGSGEAVLASSGSGGAVGINGSGTFLAVPAGYTSGRALSDMSAYNGATFTSLGVTPGTYEWTWGTGPNQNFRLDIVATAVPEPSGLALLALPLGLVAFAIARHRWTRAAFV